MKKRYSSDPFLMSNEDGVQHAVKDDIKVSILPDVENAEMKHKVIVQPLRDSSGVRILKILIGDLKIFVNNNHFVITKKELYPKLEACDADWCVENIMKYVSVDKDEKGRYTINNEKNLKTLKNIVETSLEYKNAENIDRLNTEIRKLLDN